MDCPSCSYPETRVIESRPEENKIRRRRQCMKCGFRVTTEELIKVPRKKKEFSSATVRRNE